ncbi:ABC transporter permease [Streptomyces sp. NBC_01622]|uniref:ABC transporter permease n=1 Tax=Streptomyces sp. NBC_01622 TaxID=2975903 RepID=UPI003870C731|nr:ABC transporter permease [Streptomyces sp. NBC_01622]
MTALSTPRTVGTQRWRTAFAAVEGPELVLLGVIALLWVGLALGTDTFLSGVNVQNILSSVAPVALIGIGMTAVIVTGGIDVSVGSAVAVVMVVAGKAITVQHVGMGTALLIAMVVGGLLGAFNGAVIALTGIHPIVMTFATLNLFRFLSLEIFGPGNLDGVPDTLRLLGGGSSGRLLGVPNSWWLSMLIGAAVWFYMRNRPSGRHWYAIGGDANAARLAAIRVRRRVIAAYVLVGVMTGLAGCVLIGSGGTVQQNSGTGLELKVIAAVVIGGTSILGGRGTVLGTLLGALLVGTVTSAVTILNWPSQLANLFVGIFIVLAVGTDVLRERRRRAL